MERVEVFAPISCPGPCIMEDEVLLSVEVVIRFESLPESPIGWGNIRENRSGRKRAISYTDLERKWLTHKHSPLCPNLAPGVIHGHYSTLRRYNRESLNIPSSSDVRDQDASVVWVSVDSESHPSRFWARDPAIPSHQSRPSVHNMIHYPKDAETEDKFSLRSFLRRNIQFDLVSVPCLRIQHEVTRRGAV